MNIALVVLILSPLSMDVSWAGLSSEAEKTAQRLGHYYGEGLKGSQGALNAFSQDIKPAILPSQPKKAEINPQIFGSGQTVHPVKRPPAAVAPASIANKPYQIVEKYKNRVLAKYWEIMGRINSGGARQTDAEERKIILLSMISAESLPPTPAEIDAMLRTSSWIGIDFLRKMAAEKVRINITTLRRLIAGDLGNLSELALFGRCQNIEALDTVQEFFLMVADGRVSDSAKLEIANKYGGACFELTAKFVNEKINAMASIKGILMYQYKPGLKQISIARDKFVERALAHELSHAVDDILERDKGFFTKKSVSRSDIDKEFLSLFENYKEQLKKGDSWSNYPNMAEDIGSDSGAAEYFAHGIEFLLYNPEPLKQKDPAFFKYLTRLIDTLKD